MYDIIITQYNYYYCYIAEQAFLPPVEGHRRGNWQEGLLGLLL